MWTGIGTAKMDSRRNGNGGVDTVEAGGGQVSLGETPGSGLNSCTSLEAVFEGAKKPPPSPQLFIALKVSG